MLSAAIQSSQTIIQQLCITKRTLNFQENEMVHTISLIYSHQGKGVVGSLIWQIETKATVALLLPLVCYHRNSPSVYADSYVMVLQLWLWTESISSWHIQLQLLYRLQHQVFIKKLEGLLFFLDNQLPFLPPGQGCSLSVQRH